MPEKALVVEHLTWQCLRDISFSVDSGEFIVIVGPSPCGKTVLLNCLMGFEKPESGVIYLNGVNVTDVPTYKRDMSLVFQDMALFPHLNVFSNISFGLRMLGHPKKTINSETEEVLKLVRLEGLGNRRIRQLSGGQMQRVALARSLVLKPSILLFDEPIGALDLKLRQRMLVEFKSLHQQLGFTALYVTHDPEQAMTLADRIIVMNEGQIEQVGTPIEVYSNPRNITVAELLGEINTVAGEVMSISKTHVTVKSVFGEFKVNLNGRTIDATSKKIKYCIRPEKVFIGEPAKGKANRIEVKLVNQIYHGTCMEYVVQLPNGEKFRTIAKGRYILDMQPLIGQEVPLGWDPNDGMILEN